MNNILSTYNYNPVMSDIEYIPEADDTFTQTAERGHFGRFKVLLDNQCCTITIGPDYCFFIPAFAFFLVIGTLIVKMVFSSSDNLYFRLATILVCLGQPLSYLNVALSNPGIVSRSIIQIPIEEISTIDALQTAGQSQKVRNYKQKYCKKCNIYIKPTTYHCGDCQLCIQGYDHHCPWVSKCIGKKNLAKFYFFLTMTPIFMIYSFISFFACATLGFAERTTVQL